MSVMLGCHRKGWTNMGRKIVIDVEELFRSSAEYRKREHEDARRKRQEQERLKHQPFAIKRNVKRSGKTR